MYNVKQWMFFLCQVVFNSSCHCQSEESKVDAEIPLLLFFRKLEKSVCLC